MGEHSAIEWTDASWTPIRARRIEIQNDGSGKERVGWHCEPVSPECEFCYAERLNLRLGTGLPFKPDQLFREEKVGYHNGELTPAELADLKAKAKAATPGKWELVASTVYHGAYVCGPYGGDICDCYVMSKPSEPSTLNGGTSKPVPFMGEKSDANAAHIAAANPETILRLVDMVERRDAALTVIRDMPVPEQDNMLAANMRKVASEALSATEPQT